MSSLSDNARSIVDRWVIEAGRYVGIGLMNQGLLSTQGEDNWEIERRSIAETTYFLEFKRRA